MWLSSTGAQIENDGNPFHCLEKEVGLSLIGHLITSSGVWWHVLIPWGEREGRKMGGMEPQHDSAPDKARPNSLPLTLSSLCIRTTHTFIPPDIICPFARCQYMCLSGLKHTHLPPILTWFHFQSGLSGTKVPLGDRKHWAFTTTSCHPHWHRVFILLERGKVSRRTDASPKWFHLCVSNNGGQFHLFYVKDGSFTRLNGWRRDEGWGS